MGDASYDDADVWGENAPVEDAWDEPPADGDAFPIEGHMVIALPPLAAQAGHHRRRNPVRR